MACEFCLPFPFFLSLLFSSFLVPDEIWSLYSSWLTFLGPRHLDLKGNMVKAMMLLNWLNMLEVEKF